MSNKSVIFIGLAGTWTLFSVIKLLTPIIISLSTGSNWSSDSILNFYMIGSSISLIIGAVCLFFALRYHKKEKRMGLVSKK